CTRWGIYYGYDYW
nr:immunoglobulin heavy chain junction region [Mus musculus]